MKIRILYFCMTCLIMSSCSTKFSLQKRKYNKGFFVSNTNILSKSNLRAQKFKLSDEVNQRSQIQINSGVLMTEPKKKIIAINSENKNCAPIINRSDLRSGLKMDQKSESEPQNGSDDLLALTSEKQLIKGLHENTLFFIKCEPGYILNNSGYIIEKDKISLFTKLNGVTKPYDLLLNEKEEQNGKIDWQIVMLVVLLVLLLVFIVFFLGGSLHLLF